MADLGGEGIGVTFSFLSLVLEFYNVEIVVDPMHRVKMFTLLMPVPFTYLNQSFF